MKLYKHDERMILTTCNQMYDLSFSREEMEYKANLDPEAPQVKLV